MDKNKTHKLVRIVLQQHVVIPQYGMDGIVVCSCSNAVSRDRYEYMAHLEVELHRAIDEQEN